MSLTSHVGVHNAGVAPTNKPGDRVVAARPQLAGSQSAPEQGSSRAAEGGTPEPRPLPKAHLACYQVVAAAEERGATLSEV